MGLAAGQEYTVTITGEIDGRRGTESSAEFMTREFVLDLIQQTQFRVSLVTQWKLQETGENSSEHLDERFELILLMS